LSNNQSKPKITHLALKVVDADQAAKVFKDVFGFIETDRRRDGDHVSLHLTDGSFDLALVTFDSEHPDSMGGVVGEGPCIHHFGIDVDDTAKFSEELKQAGAEILTDPTRPDAKTIKFTVPGGGGMAEIAPMDWHKREQGNA
jgi:catechol 2,3-dioxygenase-like lactoylglutathione lyase family enzyme